jgi:hypothetical protein
MILAMFSKDKPTKRVEFEGGWVDLQHLSKGVKDQIASRLSASLEGLDPNQLKNLDKNSDEMPAGMIGMVGKVQQVEYYKLSQAIKAWSADTTINEETVQGLDEEVFNKISEEINKMNELSKEEIKN